MDPTPQELDRLRRTLERCVARVCPRWLAGQREDLVQDAMIKVQAMVRRGEQDGVSSSSYLRAVAYSATVDEIRRRRRREVGVQDEVLESVAPSEAPGPDRRLDGGELGRAIGGCLTALSGPRRLAVALHLYGFGREESVKVLGWSDKRVDNLRYRGLADLRRCLESKGYAP